MQKLIRCISLLEKTINARMMNTYYIAHMITENIYKRTSNLEVNNISNTTRNY